jgi:hypothetical protein
MILEQVSLSSLHVNKYQNQGQTKSTVSLVDSVTGTVERSISLESRTSALKKRVDKVFKGVRE